MTKYSFIQFCFIFQTKCNLWGGKRMQKTRNFFLSFQLLVQFLNMWRFFSVGFGYQEATSVTGVTGESHWNPIPFSSCGLNIPLPPLFLCIWKPNFLQQAILREVLTSMSNVSITQIFCNVKGSYSLSVSFYSVLNTSNSLFAFTKIRCYHCLGMCFP